MSLRPLMEKLVHKARGTSTADNEFLLKTLFKTSAIRKLRDEIVPRFKDLPAGFTRVKYLGRRSNDKAKVGMIELIGNPIEIEEKEEEQAEIE